jgi:hypothetical protein
MKAYQCDKCGSLHDGSPVPQAISVLAVRATGWKRTARSANVTIRIEPMEAGIGAFDLCVPCVRELAADALRAIVTPQ